MYESALLLHNIRSTHNVGSIFRTADSVGIGHIYLTGYTPQPIDSFGRPRPEIAKTALGAELTLSWTYRKSPQPLVRALKLKGWHIVGIEQDKDSIDYKTYTISGPTLFILGNEVLGMSPALRSQCDTLVEIPMKGEKESLNVSVAAGVALYRILDR